MISPAIIGDAKSSPRNSLARVEVIENQIIELEAIVNEESGNAEDQIYYIVDKIKKIYSKSPNTKYSILGVENPDTKPIKVPLRIRELGIEIFEHPQTDLVALENHNTFYRTLISIIALVSGISSKLKFFPDRESALNWIHEKRNITTASN